MMQSSIDDFIKAILNGPARRVEGEVILCNKAYKVTAYTISRQDKSPLLRVDIVEKS